MILWTRTPPSYYHPISQLPTSLHLHHLWCCITAQKVSFSRGRCDFRHREMTSLLRAPNCNNQSLSGHSERQSLPQSHCDRCAHSSMEERAHGSRLTTIGRVVQSKTPEPETLSVLYGRVEPAGRWSCVCVCSQWVFYGICVGKDVHLLRISAILEKINDKNPQVCQLV